MTMISPQYSRFIPRPRSLRSARISRRRSPGPNRRRPRPEPGARRLWEFGVPQRYRRFRVRARPCARRAGEHRSGTPESSSADWGSFESSGIAIGNHWLSPNGEMLVWSDGRAPLTEPIAAGSCGRATLKITAPATNGRYLLEVDLVEEGVRWFGEKTSPPLHIPVVVGERSACDARPSELLAAGAVRLKREYGASPAHRTPRSATSGLTFARRPSPAGGR